MLNIILQLLKSRLVDKILFVCSILFVLTTVFTVYHWSNNAFFVSRSGPHGIALNDDGLVATGELGYINIWNNQHCIDQLDYHIDKVHSMAYSNNQKLLVSEDGRSVKVYSFDEQKVLFTNDLIGWSVDCIMFDQSDQYLLYTLRQSGQNKLCIWDWVNNRKIKEFGLNGIVRNISVNKNNVLAYCDGNGLLGFFDLKTMKSVTDFYGIHYAKSAVYHPNGMQLALINKNDITLIAKDGSVVSKLICKASYEPVLFSKDGKYLVHAYKNAQEGLLKVWDWRKREIINTVKINRGYFSFNNLALDHDDNLVLTMNGNIKLLDLKEGNTITNIGPMYFYFFLSVLSLFELIVLSLVFYNTFQNKSLNFANYAIMTVLTVKSFGLLLIAWFFKKQMKKYSGVFIILSIVLVTLALLMHLWLPALLLLSFPLFFIYIRHCREQKRFFDFAYLAVYLLLLLLLVFIHYSAHIHF